MATTKKRGRGRPSKLTTRSKRKLLAAIRLGTTYECAANEAGIDEKTLYRWLDRGKREKSGEYRDFCDAFFHARSEAEASLLRAIKKASKMPAATRGDFRAAAWILEKRFSGKYGKRTLELERAKLELEKLAADVELSKAKATLAATTAERIGDPLVVIIGDLSVGVTHEELIAGSPTLAHELGGSDGTNEDEAL